MLSRDFSVQEVCDAMVYKCFRCLGIASMSRAGKPTDNPVNEALNGWIKEELYMDFGFGQCRSIQQAWEMLERYMEFYNERRPCYAIGYDTPANYRRKYDRGELPAKDTFEARELSEIPKFVQRRKNKSENQ